MTQKRITSIVILICMLLSMFSLPTAGAATVDTADTSANVDVAETEANSYGLASNVQSGQILQCWNWSYNNIRNNLEKIADQGFTAIQTSPIQPIKETTSEYWNTVMNSSWVIYQPVAFNIETNYMNAQGTKTELKALCTEAHKYGIKIICDIVFNHMANDMSGNTIHPWIPSDLKDNPDCWHDITKNTYNFDDRYEVTQYCLTGLPDLNTANPTVQWHCTNILKEAIEVGVDGFRFDAIKHIETPDDYYTYASNFWPNVLGDADAFAKSTRGFTPYYYGELIGNPGGGLPVTAYTKYMSVTDPGSSDSIRGGVCGGNASQAASGGISCGAAPNKTVQWTESHDNHKDNGTNNVSEHNINKVWAIVGSKAEVCGMYLARPKDMNTTKMGDADWTSWSYPEVKAINRFKNHFEGQSEYLSSYYNLACIERGSSGMVIVNCGGTYYNGMSAPVHTMASGTYKDAITGNTFTVADGWITGDIGDTGIAVVYNSGNTGLFTPGKLTSYSLPGTFNGWDSTANVFIAETANTASTTLSLPAGTYTFKVRSGELWFGNSGTITDTTDYGGASNPWEMSSTVSSDCTLVASGGRYKFTYDAPNRKLDVKRVSSSTTCASPFYLKGDFNSWGTDNRMTYVDGSNSVTATISLDAGTYGFKLNNSDAGLWYGNWGTIVDTTTATSETGWEMDPDLSVSNCTLQATSSGKYTFTFNLSTQKLTVTKVASVTATFKDWDGKVLKTQSVNAGAAPTAPANPSRAGYTFTGWSPSVGAITEDTTFNAQYKVNSFSVSVSSNPTAGGTTKTSASTVNYGSTVTLTASPATSSNYSFTNWQITGSYTVTSGSLTSTSITISPTSAITAVANYTQAASYTVSTSAGTGGSASSSVASVVEGGSVTLTAKPSTGYSFQSWTISGAYTAVSGSTTSSSFTIKPTGNITAKANFAGNQSTIKFSAGTGGSVTNSTSATVTYPNARSSTATASTGYKFSSWTISGGTLGTDYEITSGSTTSATIAIRPLTTGKTITAAANFTGITATIKFSAGAGGSVTNSGSNSVTYPSTKTSTATALTGYNFSGWSVSGGTANTDYKITSGGGNNTSITIQPLTAGKTITATANFTIKSYVVTFLDWDGTVLSSQSVNHGSAAKAPANPTRDGYAFKGWDTDFSNITSSITVTAQYVDDAVFLLGSFNNWSTITGLMQEVSGNVLTATYTLDAGTYYFKILHQDIWYGNYGTIPDTTDYNGASNPWDMSEGADDCKLEATGGTYTFSYNKSTKKLEVLHTPPSYTVTFKNYNGVTLKTQTVVKGSSATAPTAPTRAATAQYTYTFTGWDTDFSNVQSDLTVTAQFKSTVNTYTVSFVNYDGTLIEKQTVAYGSAATAPSKTPTRAANAQYTYTFKAWDKSFNYITGNTTVTATYSQTVNKYTVTFKNYDGSILKTETVAYGSAATAPTTTPTKPADSQSSYTFSGWDKSFNNITGNLTVTAVFTATANNFTVTFKDWDGTVLKTQSVAYGKAATAPANPTRESDDMYTYTFSGWDKSFSNITANTVVTARYTKELIEFYVVFIDFYGEPVSEQLVPYGSAATAPEVPQVIEEDGCRYVFTGWDTDFSFIESDTPVFAIYEEAAATYTVTFKNFDGTVLKTEEVAEGDSATAPNVPSRVNYEFTGWDKDFSNITGNLTVTAQYKDIRVYLVGDFNSWATDTVLTTVSGNVFSTMIELEEGTYTFKILYKDVWYGNWGTIEDTTTTTSDFGWEMTEGADNCTLEASGGKYTFNFDTYTKMLEVIHTVDTYTVNFYNYNGATLKTETVPEGGSATPPEDPTRAATAQYTYTFSGWDTDYTNIQQDTDVTAMYAAEVNTYTVTFKNYDGSILSIQNVEYGDAATNPGTPVREATSQYTYTFKGWDKSFSKITQDTVVTATYNQTINKYTVTFVDWDGTLLSSQTVEYGKAATAPKNPTRTNYVFTGWDNDFDYIITNTVVTAEYADDRVYLMGDFNSWQANTVLTTVSGNIVSTTLELDEGDYLFKILHRDVWYGNGGVIPDTTDYEGNSNPWDMADGADNCTLRASGGTYTFNFNTSTKKLEVLYDADSFTVTFVNYDGTILKTQTVDKGSSATAPANPSRPSNAQYTYTFKGWDKDFTNVQSNLTVTATYTQTLNKYTVKFVNWDGSVLSTQQVEYGKSATAPESPTRNDYVFTGWDADFSNITGNLTVTAQFADNRVYLLGDFNAWATDTVMNQSGSVATVTLDLEAGDYTFKILHKDVWYGNAGVIPDTTDYDGKSNPWEMYDGADNCTLHASGGKYTFSFNTSAKMLEVTFISDAFTVTFVNYDGTVISTQAVKQGESATAPQNPTRPSNAQYTYTFKGWDKDFSDIQADTTVTATYTQTVNKYTVTFKDFDGKVLSTQTVEYGRAATAPETPVREADAKYTYTFKGWDKNFQNVTGDLEVTAHYTETLNKYTVTFKNYDGEVLSTQQIEYGKGAVAPKSPVREADVKYTYTFKAWDKDFSNITGDLEVTAHYTETLNKYTVTFVNYDGTVIDTQQVEYGSAAVAPEAPAREADAQYTYTFKAWDKDFSNITGDLTVTATYTESLKEYTVVFIGFDGELLDMQTVPYGGSAVAPEAPVVEGYVFTGWDTDFTNITSETIVNAVYEEFALCIPGDFNNWSSEENLTVNDKGIASMTLELEPGTYTFKVLMNGTWYGNWGVIEDTTLKTSEIGWEMTEDADNCTLNASGGTYTFNFNTSTKMLEIIFAAPKYTVTFMDWDGTLLKSEAVTRGESATAPKAPDREGFDFRGWDTDFTNIQADTVVTAVYEEIISEYTVTFVNYDGTVIKKEVVRRGESATAPDAPERAANAQFTFIFKGWDKSFENVTDDLTVTAVFESVVNKYTVTFVDYDGTELKVEQVEYGKSATAPETAQRVGFVFTGWDTEFEAVTESLTVTAQYAEDVVYLLGSFNNWATDITMSATDTENVVTATVELMEGTYYFKLLNIDKWYGNAGTIEDTTLATSEIGWEMTDGADDCTLKASGGTYTFNFNKETRMLEVIYIAPEYTVTFIDWNGTTLKTETVKKGKSATAPEDPVREGYVFTGWNKEFTNVQSDLIVTATYLMEAVTYTVTFVDYDGTVLSSQIVTTGKAATAPKVPQREGYAFIGWDKDFSKITYNLTVTALYEDVRVYLLGSFNEWATDVVMTESEDGTVLSAQLTLKAGTHYFKILHKDVWYGNAGIIEDTTLATSEIGWEMVADATDATLEASGGKYTFNFNLDTKMLEVLYTPVTYTVTFTGAEGAILSTQTVNYGAAATAPQAPAVEGYLFSKWDKDFSSVESDMTVTAVYVVDTTVFTVTFKDADGTVLKTEQVSYGKSATAPEAPAKTGFLFTGWDKEFTAVTSDLTVTAQYKDNAVYLYGSFNDWAEGTSLKFTEGSAVVSTELTLPKGTYYFKLLNLDNWYGNAGIIEDTTISTSEIGWEMTTDTADATLEASGGKYTFNFNTETKMLEILYTPVEFTVVFTGFDGELLSSQKVALGGNAVAPEAPKVEGYIFSGWDTDFTNVQSETVVNAVYIEDTSKFTVVFTDYDGTVIDTQQVSYGKSAEAPADPVRVGYIFTGWDKDFSKITANTTVVAQYKDNQIYLVGSFNEWTTDVALTRVEDSTIFCAQLILEEGSYYFKLLQNDVWFTNASTVVDTTDTISALGIELRSDSALGDTILNASGGTYTFRFDTLTNRLVILYSDTVEKFTVTFVDYDGTVLSTQEVVSGEAAVAPEIPEREENAQYIYTFAGWDKEFENVTENLTITATYIQAVKSYKVTFTDTDGTVLGEEIVVYGEAAMAPDIPTKEGYIFTGWDKDFSVVTEDMTVTAQYAQGVASNVTLAGTFNGWNPAASPFFVTTDSDKVSLQMKLEEGTYQFKVVIDGSNWFGNDGTMIDTTASTSEDGWQMSNSAGDCTLVACGGTYIFNYTVSTSMLEVIYVGSAFTVTFVDYNGTVLATETVEPGKSATAPEVPERSGYTFTGWDIDFSKVYSNLTVTATYAQGTNLHKVTFLDTDGTVIDTVYVSDGGSAVAPFAPVKNGYIFNGWDKSFGNVTADMTVTAKYIKGTESKVSIAGTFNGWNPDASKFLVTTSNRDKVSLQMNLSEGTYQFKVVEDGAWYGNWGTIADTTVTTSSTGWVMDPVAGDCTLIAGGGTYIFTYTISTHSLEVKYVGSQFKVTFVDWDGTVLKTEVVEPGGSATPPRVSLTRPADEGYTYKWSGWDMDYTNVFAPLRVTAVYKATPRVFTVRFVNWNGALLKTQSVAFGTAATPPADPTRAGYIFTGWDGDINYVTGNMTFTAQYMDNGVYVMGDFNDWGGTPLRHVSGTIYQGSFTLAPGQYKFKIKQGWDWLGNNGCIDDTTTYTSDTGWEMTWDAGDCTLNASGSTYTFRFNTATRMLEIFYVAPTYTVTFKDWNGATLKTQYVKRGNPAYAPANPSRAGYVFTGWDADFSWISANMIITAQYALNTVSVMGDFNNWSGTAMVPQGGNIFTSTIELAAGTYKFKIKHADTWYGNNGTIDNSTAVTSDVGWEMAWDAGDCTLNAAGGTYTFRFNTETRFLEIFYAGAVYTVTFIDWDGSIISTQQVEFGKSAVAPADPVREGYTFSGWSADFSFITGNATIMAQYGDVAVYLRGTFNDWGLSSPMRGSMEKGVYTYVMTLPAGTYIFKVFTADVWYGNDGTIEDSTLATSEVGWEMNEFAGDCTLNAAGGTYMFRYNTETKMLEILRVVDEVSVTFVDWDGTIIKVETVKFGGSATAPTDLVRDGYTLIGWDTAFDYVIENITVTALYRKSVVLSGSFTDEKGTEMTQEDGPLYSTTVELTKGEHTFVINFGGVAYSVDSTFADTIKDMELSTDSGECTIIATGGFYKFIFDAATLMLSVEKLPDATGDEVEPEEPSTGDEVDPEEPDVKETHKVTWNEGGNFTIVTDSDLNAVEDGTGISFTVKVEDGYKLVAVVHNMKILLAVNGVYTIDSITKDTMLIVVVEKDETVPELPTYTVTFTDKDGNTLKTEEVEYGQKATAPEAPAVEGYEFKGWSEEFDYVTMDMVVKAVYKKVVVPATTGKLRIEVTGGTGFTVSVNGSAARPQGTSYVNTKAPIGATVTVVANECQGLEFLGWVNEAGAIVSTAKTYTFTTSGNDVLRAVYKTDVEGVNVVIFKNGKAAGGKGQVLDMQYYAAGDEVVFPGAPTAAGYDFTGWDKTAEEIKALIAAGEDVTVLATWEAAKIYIDVAVNGGTISTPAQSNGKYLAYNALTVVANAAEAGKKFAYWTDAKGNIMSYDAEYKFFPATSTELTAVYVAEDEEIKKQPLVFIAADPTTAGEKITYTMSWDIDANIGTVTSAGLLVVNKADYNGDTFYHGTTDTKVFDRALGASAIKQKNTYGIGKGSSLYDNTYIACTFVVYTDAVTGESITVYSTPVEVYKPAP